MIVPAGVSPMGTDGWGVVLTYEEDGRVDDSDAGSIDYRELLEQLQSDAEASNRARREAGYETVEIVGWASPPRYDSAAKKLHWAKELAFSGSDEHTLNYDIRVLGRRGVLVVQAVGSMSQLDSISGAMVDVLGQIEFNEGHRYSDFDPSVDKVAAYGIGALVAGKVAAKAGLFAKLGALLLAGKKFIVFALAGLAAAVKSMFGRKAPPDEPGA